MRKIIFIFTLWLGAVVLGYGADTYTLDGGGSVTGDVVKFDDNGMMLHMDGDTYTNVPWAHFSQDSLKQLYANAKMKGFVEPFIAPDESARPPKPEIQVNPVTRMDRPANPSIFGGLFKSGLGLFILLLIYAANLYAAFEISIVKARSAAQVMGLSAVLPIIGPVIFLIMPMYVYVPPPETPAPDAAPAHVPGKKTQEQIQIAEASWKQQEEREKKPEPQIFARGKFTFNKRFLETRFAPWLGAADGEQAKKFSMELRTVKDVFNVERIAQVGATEIILEVPTGQVTVALADIQEIKLNPRPN